MSNILKTSTLALVLVFSLGLSGCETMGEWFDGMMGIAEETR